MVALLQPRVFTLAYVIRDGKILLIHKKRGFGKGYYNGVGGKVHAGETLEDAAIREFREEVCASPGPLEWRGVLEFYNNGSLEMIVHVFVTGSYTGKLCETEEARPQWFGIDDIPYDKMWADDRHWFPLLLSGQKFYGRFWFRDWKEIENYFVYKLQNP
ncbi:MAG: 8-oxo-dGTP diphosphatase [Candidatus Diapherotrites archaeon]|nr:8-oxo-dGTP diphosphatase [Candidatus Diapherotrites archaeon]MDN5366616.1 8-oxo-dGTP diphosphatase [Candidatus Diapherotrites archaeon]